MCYSIPKTLAWSFVFAVTLADMTLTYRLRTTLDIWEANPIAVILNHFGGLWLPLSLRFCSVVYAAILAHMKHKLTKFLTWYTTSINGVLCLILIQAWLVVCHLG